MDLSIPVGGIQTASAAFDSAARSIAQAFNGNSTPSSGGGDSVDLSTAVAGLLASKTAFLANEQVALVEDSLTRTSFSVLG